MKLTQSAVIALIIFFTSSLSAQQLVTSEKAADTAAKGSVEVIQDSRIDSIVKMHIAYNKTQDGMMGYRVQIFFDAGNNSLDRAEAAALEYQTLYPADTAYISFTEPYYKVRVGDFRTRIEAEGFMHKILGDYPNAFVIKDRIRFPEL
jgi:hypothetical protein